MSAQIIDFAQKQREKREREFLQTDITELSPEELKNLSLSLRMHIIDSAIANGYTVYKQEGYTVIMHEGVAWSIPDVQAE